MRVDRSNLIQELALRPALLCASRLAQLLVLALVIIKASIKNEFGLENTLMIHNPHNMYVLILAQFGLLGLLALLYMFYTQIKIATKSNEEFVRKIGVALPLLYLLIMLSDSYLMVHMTGLLFIFLSSFIYKDYETESRIELKTEK